jgi:methionine synthase II (cobalamin-independent)
VPDPVPDPVPSPDRSRAPWPAGTATGVGSLPGTDPRAALGTVLDTVPDLPFLPELPARGPGAEMTGRALALMPDVAASWGPTGWTVADSRGRDLRRAESYLDQDLDVAEEMLQGYDGPLKAQLCGPWTLAGTLELRNGRRALADPGAVRDLGQALAEAAAAHVAELAKRVPGAQVLLQLDEPLLPAVLHGELRSPSGMATIAAVDEPVVEQSLAASVAACVAAGAPVVAHLCVDAPPVRLLRRCGFAALSLDATLLTPADDDEVAEAVEAGVALLLGLVPTAGDLPTGPDAARDVAAPARRLWQRTGLVSDLLGTVAVTPTCGLAGSSQERAVAALRLSRAAARSLVDDPEELDMDDPRG